MIISEYYRRNLKTAGLSLSIVVDVNGRRLKPIKEERSKSGAHGEDLYLINNPVYVLRYNVSNSGKVSWSIVYVDPNNIDQLYKRVYFKDLPLTIMKRIVKECEKEGLEIYPWEEEVVEQR